MFRAHVLIVRRAKLYYTVSGIITQTSEWSKITKIIKIIKIQFYKYEHMVVKFMCEFFGITYYKHVMTCRGYVYPVIKLIRKVLCLFTFMFVESI